MTDRYSALQTTLALFEQNDRLMRLYFPREDGPAAQLVPEQLQATEELSRDFQFSVTVLSNDASIASQDVIGKMVCVELVQKDGGLRYFNGYVFEFRRVGTDGGLATYRMRLGPWLAFLKLRQDNYLFHDKTISDQTAEIFKDYPLADYEIRINGADAPLTLATQWQESDYNYLQRRWEDRGWHYWYEHRPDGHTLVLSDDSQLAEAIDANPHVRYHDSKTLDDGDAIAEWSPIRHLASTAYTHSSFDFKNPTPQWAATPTLNDQGTIPSLEVYEYAGAYGFKDSQHGAALARLRMEALESQAHRFQATGDCARLQPGRWFELTDHYDYRGALEEDRQFLVVEVSHQAHNNYLQPGQPALYRNQATCVARKTPWRPGRGMNSTEPKLYGLLTAAVVGPENEEVYCDEYGRVRVQFHFDREGQFDQRSSCWIRVASNWAGDRFGLMALPRIGQEVLVQFLDGNPDKPLITGRVYNQDQMPPWELGDQQALMGIRSKEIQGEGFNHLILDDTPQQIQAQFSSTHECSQLNLGHITRIPGTVGRQDHRGQGFELRSDGWGAIRAGKGLYVGADARPQAEGAQLDLQEAIDQLQKALHIAQSLARAAGTAQAVPSAVDHQAAQLETVFSELKAPGILVSSPQGVAVVTPQSAQVSAETHVTLTSGENTEISAYENFTVAAGQAVSMLAIEDDMKVIANQGEMKIQAQNNQMEIAANKTLKILSTEDQVVVSADKEILLTSGGAYIKIKDGHIYLHAPGVIEHKGGQFPFLGPTSLGVDYDLPEVAMDPISFKRQGVFILSSHPQGKGLLYTHEPYKLYKDDQLIQEGLTDDKAAIVYEREEGAHYRVETSSGHRFDVEPMAFLRDEQEALAHALGQIGFRSRQSSVKERLPAYFKRETGDDRGNA
ncbi:MAG: type VI secretion system tip protein VgrG [Azoarcus sp.]|jgi:type VI secretion system secreted protein VgrG|nr:type VI secretion system tip protein VgrG [Azoarcus sp.]